MKNIKTKSAEELLKYYGKCNNLAGLNAFYQFNRKQIAEFFNHIDNTNLYRAEDVKTYSSSERTIKSKHISHHIYIKRNPDFSRKENNNVEIEHNNIMLVMTSPKTNKTFFSVNKQAFYDTDVLIIKWINNNEYILAYIDRKKLNDICTVTKEEDNGGCSLITVNQDKKLNFADNFIVQVDFDSCFKHLFSEQFKSQKQSPSEYYIGKPNGQGKKEQKNTKYFQIYSIKDAYFLPNKMTMHEAADYIKATRQNLSKQLKKGWVAINGYIIAPIQLDKETQKMTPNELFIQASQDLKKFEDFKKLDKSIQNLILYKFSNIASLLKLDDFSLMSIFNALGTHMSGLPLPIDYISKKEKFKTNLKGELPLPINLNIYLLEVATHYRGILETLKIDIRMNMNGRILKDIIKILKEIEILISKVPSQNIFDYSLKDLNYLNKVYKNKVDWFYQYLEDCEQNPNPSTYKEWLDETQLIIYQGIEADKTFAEKNGNDIRSVLKIKHTTNEKGLQNAIDFINGICDYLNAMSAVAYLLALGFTKQKIQLNCDCNYKSDRNLERTFNKIEERQHL